MEPAPTSTRRRPLVLAGVGLGAIVVLGLAAGALLQANQAESAEAKTRAEAHVSYPGSELVDETWQEEEHARYIDTGGYDERAGWIIEYALGQPASFVQICDHFERQLQERGWRLRARDDEEEDSRSSPAFCNFTRGDGEDPMQFRVLVGLGTHDSLTDHLVRSYSVEYLLPYEVEPTYDG